MYLSKKSMSTRAYLMLMYLVIFRNPAWNIFYEILPRYLLLPCSILHPTWRPSNYSTTMLHLSRTCYFVPKPVLLLPKQWCINFIFTSISKTKIKACCISEALFESCGQSFGWLCSPVVTLWSCCATDQIIFCPQTTMFWTILDQALGMQVLLELSTRNCKINYHMSISDKFLASQTL